MARFLGRRATASVGFRLPLAVALSAMASLFGCDALMVDPPEPRYDLGLRLAVAASAPDSAILAKLDQVVVRLIRPDGFERDTALWLQKTGGTARTRLRVTPAELVVGLEVQAVLKGGWREYYRGGTTVTSTQLSEGSAAIDMAPVVWRILISPSPLAFVGLGDTTRLVAVGYFPSGEQIPDFKPQWTSSDATVVTVASDGLAHGQARGKAIIEARSGQVAATVIASVRQVAAQVRQIMPDRASLQAGQSLRLKIVGLDSRGLPLDDGAAATWEVQPPGSAVLSVSSSGLVLARSGGTASVTARGTAGAASAIVEVIALPHPAPAVLVMGGTGTVVGSDLAGVTRTYAACGGGGGQVTRSPDGKWIAFGCSGILHILPFLDLPRPFDGPKTVVWPEFSADGSWIYFSNTGTGGVEEIWRVRPEAPVMNLVVRYGAMPTPSPDGTRVAFVRGRDLMVHEIGGESKVILKDVDPAAPAWSPDGRWIACVAGGASRLALVHPDGTEFHFLEGASFRPGLTWSPDGEWLLGFERTRNQAAVVSPSDLQIIDLPWFYAGEAAWWR